MFMPMSRRTAALLLLLPAGLAAQAPKELTLGRPSARHATEFSLIRPIRELANGSVLLADPIEKIFVRLDPTLQRRDTLGRTGRGPSEYAQPDGVYPLPGDSSLLVDLGNNRLTPVDPAGRLLAKSLPIMGPAQDGEGTAAMLPGAIDRLGRLWFGGPPDGDSLPLKRFDRASGKTTVVTRLAPPPLKRTESGTPNNRSVSVTQVPLGPADGWAVSSSGVAYLVRVAPYRVEVLPATGARLRGPEVPYTPVRIGEAEKKEYGEASGRGGGLGMRTENNNGEVTMSLSRGRGQVDAWKTMQFPATKPPFDPSQLHVDPTDRLWVRRHTAAGQPATYDVFSPAGVRVAVVRFPAGRRLLGFGARELYAIHYDEDDLQYLERYPVPR